MADAKQVEVKEPPSESAGETKVSEKTDAQKAAPPAQYSVRGSVGSGPFSRVEVWTDKSTGDTVIAKTITSQVDAEEFAAGARGLLGLDSHPSVLKTLGFLPQTRSSHAALLTAHTTGGTLDSVLKNPSSLSPTQRAIILVGVVESLKYLHGKQLVHGRLKPSNVALDRSGEPQVILHAGIFKNQQGGADSDPFWTSPEVLNSGEATSSSDIYSLSLVAFELMTDKPVFDRGLKTWPLMQAIMNGVRPEVPALPDALRSLLARSWDIDPGVRPTAAEWFETLSVHNFAILPDVDVDKVRKYVSKFESGVQPGETALAAEARANARSREDIESLKSQLAAVQLRLNAAQLASYEVASQFDKVVPLLLDRIEVLEAKVQSLTLPAKA